MSEDFLLSLVPVGVGFLLFGMAVIMYVRIRLFLKTAQAVKGTVIEMVYRRKSTSNRGGGYLPVYRFRTLDGKKITAKDSLSRNPPQFQVGQEVDVLYNPENPHNARINKWLNLYFLPVLLGGLGLLFGGIGVLIVFSKVFAN
ncbi:MAG: DUF3592 domain-containing protein [Anaerolineales bacterium]|nr:DUF3592 domain-containing protein [Anaerolineales bacterium]